MPGLVTEMVTKQIDEKSVTEGAQALHLQQRVDAEGRKASQPCPS